MSKHDAVLGQGLGDHPDIKLQVDAPASEESIMIEIHSDKDMRYFPIDEMEDLEGITSCHIADKYRLSLFKGKLFPRDAVVERVLTFIYDWYRKSQIKPVKFTSSMKNDACDAVIGELADLDLDNDDDNFFEPGGR